MIRRLIAAALVLFGASLPPSRVWAGTVRARADHTLTAAETLAAAERLPEALAACNAYLARHPRDRAARVLQADLLAWTGNVTAALPAYAALIAATPADRTLRLKRALARRWQGDLIAAEAELAGLAPHDPEAAAQLADLRSSPEWPVAQARAAVDADPTNVTAAIALATALAAAEQTWEAQEAVGRAQAASPNNPQLEALAASLANRATADAAGRVEARRPALAQSGDGDPRRVEQASDLQVLGRSAAAAAEYGRFARAHPERRDIRLQEARIRSWSGDLGRATALYDGLIQAEPDDWTTRLEAARVLAWDGSLTAAAGAAALLKDRPDVGPDATALLGDVARWSGARVGPAAMYRVALTRGVTGDAALEARRVLDRDARYWLVTPEFRWFHDSEDFTSTGGSVRLMHQIDFATRLLAAIGHTTYQQRDRRRSVEHGLVSLEHEWTSWRASVDLGVRGYSSGPVRPVAAARMEWFPQVETMLGLGYDHYDLVDEVTTLRAIAPLRGERTAGNRILQGDRARAWLRWPLPGDVRLTADVSLASIGDGNRLDTAALTLGRRIWRRPRLDLTLDVRTYGAADREPRYWSPTRYWTTGATVSVEQGLGWGVTLRGEGRGGYAEEDGEATAEVSYAILLTTDPNQPWTIAIGYRSGQSARTGGYGTDAVTASLTYRPPTSVP